jgi:curved DNA-binding protein CbpA
MDTEHDYYATLGVRDDAPLEVIAAAYRALSKKYHPDVAGNAHMDRFRLITEAYEILSNFEARQGYDDWKNNPDKADTPNNSNINTDSAWRMACQLYPDLEEKRTQLSAISRPLSESFVRTLIETKMFQNRDKMFIQFRNQFIGTYFGSNKIILNLVENLIKDNEKEQLLYINKMIKAVGNDNIDENLINLLKKNFPLYYNDDIYNKRSNLVECFRDLNSLEKFQLLQDVANFRRFGIRVVDKIYNISNSLGGVVTQKGFLVSRYDIELIGKMAYDLNESELIEFFHREIIPKLKIFIKQYNSSVR